MKDAMQELLALFIGTFIIFAQIWAAIFGVFCLLAGLLWGIGVIYIALGIFLILASLSFSFYMNYYLYGETPFFIEKYRKFVKDTGFKSL